MEDALMADLKDTNEEESYEKDNMQLFISVCAQDDDWRNVRVVWMLYY
jgi:hypothetical protein